MTRRLLLLTGPFEAQFVRTRLVRPEDAIVDIQTLDQLERAVETAPEPTRLLAFCTAVIVPERLLRLLPGPSYNIHPGPPGFPGRHPECWGAYEGCRRFGATLHEMVTRVDEGPIVDVEWVDTPAGAGQIEIGRHAFRAAVALLVRWVPRLLADGAALPRNGHAWSGRKSTLARIDAMRLLPPDIDEAEFERRRRAFAEVPGARLTVTLHGQDFVYTAPALPPAVG